MKKLTRADLQAIEDYNDEYFFEKADCFLNSVEANSYYLLAGLMGNREAIYRLAKSNQLGVADTQASKKQLTLALLWL